MSNQEKDEWSVLEEMVAGDKAQMEKDLFDCAEDIEIDLSVNCDLINKEFKQPDDEIAYEIWLSIPNSFTYKDRDWSKGEFTKHLQDKGVNTSCSQTMAEIKKRIADEQQRINLIIEDSDMDDLLKLMSKPQDIALEDRETVDAVSNEEQLKEETPPIEQIWRTVLQLQDRIEILEEENKLLKEINKALTKEKETLIKSNNNISDELSVDEVINTLLPPQLQPTTDEQPKKRRGRPKGHKVSEATKAKQRAARMKKLNKEIQENLRFHLSTECHGSIGTMKINYKLKETTDKGYIYECQDQIGNTWSAHAQFIQDACGQGIIDSQFIFVPKGKENNPMQNWSPHID